MAGKATSTNRKDSRVEYRSMVTLDADNAESDLPARVEGLGLTALVHSTYSHTTDKPRYRVIIPLMGPGLTEEEYPRAARGLMDSTIQSYFLKGMLPAPEIFYMTGKGRRPGWSIDTVEHWMNNR